MLAFTRSSALRACRPSLCQSRDPAPGNQEQKIQLSMALVSALADCLFHVASSPAVQVRSLLAPLEFDFQTCPLKFPTMQPHDFRVPQAFPCLFFLWHQHEHTDFSYLTVDSCCQTFLNTVFGFIWLVVHSDFLAMSQTRPWRDDASGTSTRLPAAFARHRIARLPSEAPTVLSATQSEKTRPPSEAPTIFTTATQSDKTRLPSAARSEKTIWCPQENKSDTNIWRPPLAFDLERRRRQMSQSGPPLVSLRHHLMVRPIGQVQEQGAPTLTGNPYVDGHALSSAAPTVTCFFPK